MPYTKMHKHKHLESSPPLTVTMDAKKLQCHSVDIHSYEVQLIKTLPRPLFSGDLDSEIHIHFIDTRKVCNKFWVSLKLRFRTLYPCRNTTDNTASGCLWQMLLQLKQALIVACEERQRSRAYRQNIVCKQQKKDFITPTWKQMNHLKEDRWWLPMIAASSRESLHPHGPPLEAVLSPEAVRAHAWLIQCNGYVILVNVNNSKTKTKVSLSCIKQHSNQLSHRTQFLIKLRVLLQLRQCAPSLSSKSDYIFWATSFGSSEIFTVLNVFLWLGPNPDPAPLRQTNWDCSKKCQ